MACVLYSIYVTSRIAFVSASLFSTGPSTTTSHSCSQLLMNNHPIIHNAPPHYLLSPTFVNSTRFLGSLCHLRLFYFLLFLGQIRSDGRRYILIYFSFGLSLYQLYMVRVLFIILAWPASEALTTKQKRYKELYNANPTCAEHSVNSYCCFPGTFCLVVGEKILCSDYER